MQEFRIQTSTYAPEFGRTPGRTDFDCHALGHESVSWHRCSTICEMMFLMPTTGSTGSTFSIPPLPKARERQNDFGGTFSGPILKNKTFFFFSYEGLRLRLPQTALTLVPDTDPADPYSRQFAEPRFCLT